MGPASRVTLRRVKSVVANDVAIHDLQSAVRHLICQLFQHLRVWRHALGLEQERKNTSGNVGVAPAHDDKIERDRKSTRLNSSHQIISYPFFSLKKQNTHHALPHPP